MPPTATPGRSTASVASAAPLAGPATGGHDHHRSSRSVRRR